MTEQSGERRVTAEVGAELISLMVPDLDLKYPFSSCSTGLSAARQVAVLIMGTAGARAANLRPHYSRSMRNCLLSSATPASTAPSSARSSG